MRPYDYDYELELQLVEVNPSADDELDIPLSMTDLLSLCREYSKLGWQMQQQVEMIVELGIQEAIATGAVSVSALPLVKEFLAQIIRNAYFGDAVDQAEECIRMVDDYQSAHPVKQASN